MDNIKIYGGDSNWSHGINSSSLAPVLISNNSLIDGGRGTFTKGIFATRRNNGNTIVIRNNNITGGRAAREAGEWAEAEGLVIEGKMEAAIEENVIDGGSLDNKGDGVDPEGPYYGGVTAIAVTTQTSTITRNQISILNPVPSDAEIGNPVWVRGITGGNGGNVFISNNHIALYNHNGPIHIFEPDGYSMYTVVNNSIFSHIKDDDASDNFSDQVSLLAYHTGATIKFLNNIDYYGTPQTEGFNFDDTVVLEARGNFSLNCDPNNNPPPSYTENNTIVSSSEMDLSNYFVDSGIDLPNGQLGDIHLVPGAPVINYGEITLASEYGSIHEDKDGRPRNFDDEDTHYDTGCYEYVD